MKKVLLFLLIELLLTNTKHLFASEEFSLNGKWQIIFDLQNQGKSRKWQIKDNFIQYYNIRDLQVPSCWETVEQDYEGVAWYGKTFRLPEGWKGHTIRIFFGAVNYRAEVWVNGEPAGYHDGGYTPFEFEIGDLLYPERENFVAVRVTGPIVNKDIEIDGFGRDDTPHWRGAITGGVWQDVKLISTDQSYIKDVFIEPDISSNTAKVHLTLQNSGTSSSDINVQFTINAKNETSIRAVSRMQNIRLDPGEHKLNIDIPIKNAIHWSPENPFLYVLNIRLNTRNLISDEKDIQFGMRLFSIVNNDFYLNGQKIYLKTGFWEGFYPNTLAFPENEEILRKEFEYAKEIGFNCLRPWRKQVPPRTLELADELGMFIIASPAIECMGQWPTATPFMESRIFNEFTELVKRDRNHPSVILWELYNEIHRQAIGRLKHKTAVLVRDLDPSRLIIDESGGWFGGSHAYMPYSLDPVTVNEIHSYKATPVHSSTYNDFKNLGKTDEELANLGLKPIAGKNRIVPGKLLFISEIGYGGLPDIDSNMSQYEREGNPLTPDYRFTKRLQLSLNQIIIDMGIKDIFPDVSSLCNATQEIQAIGNKIQLESVRVNPEVDGYCVHAFTDGDWVLGAGVLDIFRNKKKTFETIKEINQPLYLAIRTKTQNLFKGDKLGLEVTSVNELPDQEGPIRINITDAQGKSIFDSENQISISNGISKIYSNDQLFDFDEGAYTISVAFRSLKNIQSENRYPFWVYDKTEPIEQLVALVNPQPGLKAFIKSNNLRSIDPEFNENPDFKVVLVGNIDTINEVSKQKLLQTLDFVKDGGTAIYLNAVPVNPRGNAASSYQSRFMPFKIVARTATGHWISVSHVVKSHPFFKGLPANQLMGQEYQNVCAVKTITNLNSNGEIIVGSVSWDIGIPETWNYLGPTTAWQGSDVIVLPYGKGKIILSTLRLVENLGSDPVAGKILVNMLKWANEK